MHEDGVQLSEIFPQMDVNIFAVDPVAGPGNKSEEDASTIRGNVKNYLAVLSMDETRGFFKPQDIKRMDFTNRGTNVIYLPFLATTVARLIWTRV